MWGLKFILTELIFLRLMWYIYLKLVGESNEIWNHFLKEIIKFKKYFK